jgi:hypothetical protein
MPKTKDEIRLEVKGPGGTFSRESWLYLRDEPKSNNNKNTPEQNSAKIQIYQNPDNLSPTKLTGQIFIGEKDVKALRDELTNWLRKEGTRKRSARKAAKIKIRV